MYGKQTTINKLVGLLELMFMAVFVAIFLCQSESAISPLLYPIEVQENNRQLVTEWEEYLKQFNKNNQQKLNNLNGNYILLEKPPRRVHSQSKAINIMEKRGDEKRRDFEHGWEQCEFSPISCMLRRRRR